MVLYLLRGAFIVLAASVTALYLLSNQWGAGVGFAQFVLILAAAVSIACVIVAVDAYSKHKRLSSVSGIFLGLIAGLLATYAVAQLIDLAELLTAPEDTQRAEAYHNLLQGVKVLIGLICCYVAISLVLQTKDDFRFVIPYVEFAKEIRGNRPTILDTSVIVDGRVLDIVQTQVMQGTLVVPKFVLNELQAIADSGDKIRRARGRRGLDILQQLQDSHLIEVHIDETEAEGGNVDQKLISLAQRTQGRVMTNDYNLNKVAKLRGVDVVNLNDLAKAVRPVALPGEPMVVKLVKPGEGPTQGVGYLDDGTMVVVEGGRDHLNQHVELSVTSTLQTSAGRMIFGKYEGASEEQRASEPPRSEEPRPGDSGVMATAGARPRGGTRNPRRDR